MANSRGYPSNRFVSPSMALKISLILVSGIALFVLAKLSVPPISSLLSIAVPQIWAVISAWLAPPYLFFTVHFIIFVIWILSNHKPSRDHQWTPPQEHHNLVVKPKQQLTREISPEILGVIPTRASDEWAPSGEPALVLKHNLSGEREISPVISREEEPGYFQWAPREEQTVPKKKTFREKSPKNYRNKSNRVSFSEESCVTEEKSDEKSTASSSSHLEMRRNERPVLVPEREFVRKVEPEPEEPMVVEEGEVDVDDSMDATWKAIMKKTKTPRPVVPTSSRAREPEPSVGADEMNQRFEDFIRKSKDQIRLQVEETNRPGGGRFAVTNAVY